VDRTKDTENGKTSERMVFFEDMYGVRKILLDADKTIISNLVVIRKKLIPKYDHPKKRHHETNSILFVLVL